MRHLVILNVGPIKKVDIELKRFNFFIGPQSSGKSTVAKVFSTCCWIEKEVATTLNEKAIESGDKFVKLIEDFHKMTGYFNDRSVVRYETNVIKLDYENRTLNILLKEGINYERQKICYIPAERNMVTLPELQGFEFGSTNLRSFLFDWFSARELYNSDNKSDILSLGVKYFYDKDEKKYKDQIEHTNGITYHIPLSSASSGLQSVIPLQIMLQYYSDEYFNLYEHKTSFDENDKDRLMRKNLTDLMVLKPLYGDFDKSRRSELLAAVNSRIQNHDEKHMELLRQYHEAIRKLSDPVQTNFIVEEPEQNLYPYTQLDIIEYMSRVCQNERQHGYTVTTHSPYIINFLNVLILRYYKQSAKICINPADLNVFSVQDGVLMDQIQENSVSGRISVGADDLSEAMVEMYDEYRELKGM